ncbi:hypothetical protein EMCRGX_G002368 [Ephydatia muelleri]
MDICNALAMVQSVIDPSGEKNENSASDTIQRMEEATAGLEWKTSRIRRRKDKGSDLAIHAENREECFEVDTPESKRFENTLLQSLAVFSPVKFSSLTVKCLQSQIEANPLGPVTSPPTCKRSGCSSPIHYDPTFGPFEYCSPDRCRDAQLLESERDKLLEDIA